MHLSPLFLRDLCIYRFLVHFEFPGKCVCVYTEAHAHMCTSACPRACVQTQAHTNSKPYVPLHWYIFLCHYKTILIPSVFKFWWLKKQSTFQHSSITSKKYFKRKTKNSMSGSQNPIPLPKNFEWNIILWNHFE